MENSLPDSVNQLIVEDTLLGNKFQITQSLQNIAANNAVARAVTTKQMDEIGVAESASVRKVLDLPGG